MILFTTGDILQLTKVSATTFDRWCADGLVEPVSGGKGHGNHRQWSFMQAVGFVVAQQVRDSEFSCALKFVGGTVAAFGNVDEEWLTQQMKKGQRHYIHSHNGRPLLTGDSRHWGWTNVEEAYKQVTTYAKKKEQAQVKENPAPALPERRHGVWSNN